MMKPSDTSVWRQLRRGAPIGNNVFQTTAEPNRR